MVSPASAALALALIGQGGRSETLVQATHALHTENISVSVLGCMVLGWSLSAMTDADIGDGVLDIANRLWIQSGTQFQSTFLYRLREYRHPLEEVDFLHAAAGARQEMNSWASENTQGRVIEIVPDQTLNEATGLVVTSIANFAGRWAQPFDRDLIDGGTPARLGATVGAKFMHARGAFSYARLGNAKLVELPYGGYLSMVVVLPDRPAELPSVERGLADHYATWLSSMSTKNVDVYLPRWTTTSVLRAEDMAKMMPAVFGGDADFGNMLSEGRLHIDFSAFVARIAVDEGPASADAPPSTEVAEGPVATFRADRPFVYLVRDRKTGTIFFVGRLMDPR